MTVVHLIIQHYAYFIFLGGLRSYLWFLLILVPVAAAGLLVPLLILWRVKKRKKRKHNINITYTPRPSKLSLNNNNNDTSTVTVDPIYLNG
jgi:hypothetical protein